MANDNFTVFGKETVFDGVLEFTDNLVIAGKFKGTIKSTGNLDIDKTAECLVDTVHARTIVIAGKMAGQIHAIDSVELCSGSSVSGDIETSNLRIANNVDYEGQITMLDTQPKVDLLSISSEEFKQSLILRNFQAR